MITTSTIIAKPRRSMAGYKSHAHGWCNPSWVDPNMHTKIAIVLVTIPTSATSKYLHSAKARPQKNNAFLSATTPPATSTKT